MKLSQILANRFPHAFLTPRLGTQVICSLGLLVGTPAMFIHQTRIAGLIATIISTVGLIKYPPIVAIRIAFDISRRKFVSLLGENYRDEVDAYRWRSSIAHSIVEKRATKSPADLMQEIDKGNWSNIDLRWALNYARLLALQPLSESDLEKAVKIYESIFAKFGKRGIRKRFSSVGLPFARLYLDLLFTLNRFDDWRNLVNALPPKWIPNKTTAIDLLHPGLGKQLPVEPWLIAFNHEFVSNELEPINIVAGKLPSIDSIVCDPTNFVNSEQRITVIMSAFNSGPEILTAVRSVLNQSWQNIELIIVDDCSADDSYIRQAAQLDSRITLIRHAENAGTYEARNSAMKIATGDFITTHDSDDWAHPRRLEIQVNTLLENSELQATLSRALRTGPNLALSRLGYAPNRQNASSLMFRKEVFEAIGEFDHIRKGADSEYAARIASAYPGGIQLVGFAPLAIIRMGHESLSRGEFGAKWSHPARQMYRSAYLRWHFLNRKSLDRLKPATPRNFLVPRRFLDPRELAKSNSHFDIVLATNVADESLLERDILLIKALVKSDLRAGFLNLAPIGMQNSTPADLQDLLNRSSVTALCTDDNCDTDVILVTAPNMIRIIDKVEWKITAKSAYVAPSGNSTVKQQPLDLIVRNLSTTIQMPVSSVGAESAISELMGCQTEWIISEDNSQRSVESIITRLNNRPAQGNI